MLRVVRCLIDQDLASGQFHCCLRKGRWTRGSDIQYDMIPAMLVVCLISYYFHRKSVVSFTLVELDSVTVDVISGCTKCTDGSKDVHDATFKDPDIMPV